jgi:hypothetical protein
VTRRAVGAATAPPLEDVEFFLVFGPLNQGPPEFTDEQAESAWAVHGQTIMRDWPRDRPGLRPWAFWQAEFGEEPDYDDRIVLLAERGLLFEEEIAALADRRTWTDINDGSKHVDEKAVALYERVIELGVEA